MQCDGPGTAECRLSAILSLAADLAAAAGIAPATDAVLNELHELTGVERCAVLLFGSDGICRFTGARGLSEEYRAAVNGHCPWKEFARDVRPLRVDDALHDPDFAVMRTHFERERIGSLAFIPVCTEKGVAGTLMLYQDQSGAISDEMIQSASSVATYLGIAVGRVRAQEQTRRNEERLRLLVESTDVVIWEYDVASRRFLYVSPKAARYGYPLAHWLEPGFWERILHPEDRDAALAECAVEHRLTCRIIGADGAVHWVEDHVGAPEQSPEGGVLLRGAMVDVTAQKETALELSRSRDQSDAASRAKSEFLANMSHEIRTPLTAILGYADVLREELDDPAARHRRRETIDTIRNAGQHLLSIINDILDLSKIEAGKMSVESIETDLPRLLLEVESLARPRASGKGVNLSCRLLSEIPSRVLTDPTRVRQILMNLAGNAAKFTESGSVTLNVSRVPGRDGGALLRVDVDDTGPGMTGEQAALIFSPFSQADGTTTRRFGGTGLGLTISRRLARLMGGDVTLQRTVPGAGSCFRLEIALHPAPGATNVSELAVIPKTAQRNQTPQVALHGRILLAEDGPDNQRLIAFHLKKAGAEVVVADNGAIALQLIERNEARGTPFDLLLSDMQMPELDGYELARELRRRGSEIPIVALTAHAMAEDRNRCLEAGCNDYATKPIDRLRLLSTCAAWLGKRVPANAERS